MKFIFITFTIFVFFIATLEYNTAFNAYMTSSEGENLFNLFVVSFLLFMALSAPRMIKTYNHELKLSYKDAPILIRALKALTIFLFLFPYMLFITILVLKFYINSSYAIIYKLELLGLFIYMHSSIKSLFHIKH